MQAIAAFSEDVKNASAKEGAWPGTMIAMVLHLKNRR
jgi:hypothetical protein